MTNLCVAVVVGCLVTNPLPSEHRYFERWKASGAITGVPVEVEMVRQENVFMVNSNLLCTIPGICTNFCLRFERMGFVTNTSTNLAPAVQPQMGAIPTRTR